MNKDKRDGVAKPRLFSFKLLNFKLINYSKLSTLFREVLIELHNSLDAFEEMV